MGLEDLQTTGFATFDELRAQPAFADPGLTHYRRYTPGARKRALQRCLKRTGLVATADEAGQTRGRAMYRGACDAGRDLRARKPRRAQRRP